MRRALLIGREPEGDLGWDYTPEPPYEGVVIGSLSWGELLRFDKEPVLEALAAGVPVYLYTPGLPEPGRNRALAASASAARRELKNWGVLFTDGRQRHLITAEEAVRMRRAGQYPGSGAVLTPLAREILEGTE